MYKILQIGCILCGCFLLAEAKPLLVTGSKNHRAHEIGNVAPFNTLKVKGQMEIDVQQGAADEYSISLYGPENLVDLIEVTSQSGVLSLHYKQPLVVTGDHHLRVLITTAVLEKLELEQTGEVKIGGAFKTEQLSIMANGATEVDIEDLQAQSVWVQANDEAEVDISKLNCQNLHVGTDQRASFEVQQIQCSAIMLSADNRSNMEISALAGQRVTAESNHAAKIELKGKAEAAFLTARGRSSIEAGSLQADNAEVMAANGSFIDVRVSDTLSAKTESRGVVKYRGWPKEINRAGKGLVRKNS